MAALTSHIWVYAGRGVGIKTAMGVVGDGDSVSEIKFRHLRMDPLRARMTAILDSLDESIVDRPFITHTVISVLHFADGEKRYMIAPEGLTVGQVVLSGESVAPEVGNTLPLKSIPLGSIIHNIELNPGQGGSIARSAGTYAQLSARDGKYAIIKLPSGETRMILSTCLATIGTVSNGDKANEVLGKAGRKRWLGRRPRVRGVAMNPVDHPMGGGEGRASGGHPRSRKGLLAKGYKTRDKKKTSDRYIIERRKK